MTAKVQVLVEPHLRRRLPAIEPHTTDLVITQRSGANDITMTIETSTDLRQWSTDESFSRVAKKPIGDGLLQLRYHSTVETTGSGFVRVRVVIDE